MFYSGEVIIIACHTIRSSGSDHTVWPCFGHHVLDTGLTMMAELASLSLTYRILQYYHHMGCISGDRCRPNQLVQDGAYRVDSSPYVKKVYICIGINSIYNIYMSKIYATFIFINLKWITCLCINWCSPLHESRTTLEYHFDEKFDNC